MDRWAASYGSAAAFVCVCCAGPGLAAQFGNELKLRHCHNTWVDQSAMPTWGQLGCNGLIVLDGTHTVVCPASPAFLEVREAAFRHVETLLDALVAAQPAPKLKPGAVDAATGGACATVRFGADDPRTMKVSELRDEAKRLKLDTRGCVEKGDFVSLIEAARAPAAAPAPAPAATAVAAGGAALNVPSVKVDVLDEEHARCEACLLYTSPSPRDGLLSRMPSSA